MKRILQVILAVSFCIAVGYAPASGRQAFDRNQLMKVAGAMKSARSVHKKLPTGDDRARELNAMMMKSLGIKKAPQVSETFTMMDNIQFLEAPDGSVWYAVADFDYDETLVGDDNYQYVQRRLKSFKYTIYDSTFKEIGVLKDDVEYGEGETGSALFELCEVVTRKFFNYDDNYEFIFTFGVNTDKNVNRYYSMVYSLGGEKDADGNDVVLCKIDGTLGNCVNAAQDSWSENFYLTFLTEESDDSKLDSDNYLEYLETYKMVLTTYKKATYSGGPEVVARKEICYMDLPGDQDTSPALITFAENGRAYFVYSRYEKHLFVDPIGIDESLTPDNNLLIEVYSIGGFNPEPKLEKEVRIPTVQTEGESKVLWTFYGIGSLGYDWDVIKDGDDYSFVVTRQEYRTDNDEKTSDSYYIYDDEGNIDKTILERVEGVLVMSDVPGHEHQYMFITNSTMGYLLQFINVPSGETAAIINYTVDGYNLSAVADRVPMGLSYKYAFKTMTPDVDDEGNAIEQVVWLDAEGRLLSVDTINLGKEVALAQIYLQQSVLSPYLFNTDKEMEYMYLLKRYKDASHVGTDECFLVTSANTFNTVLEVGPDAEKGNIASIVPVSTKDNSALIVLFYADNKFSADIYTLPFSKFAGGDGTVENPYLISTPGDFLQIGSGLSAHYRIANDIDFYGIEMKQVVGDFTGTLDGDGKLLKNIRMNGVSGLFANLVSGAVVKNLNLMDISVDCGDCSLVGTIASSAAGATVDNVHVYALDVTTPEEGYADFGGIIGRATNFAVISNCSVNGTIDLPESSVGGIVASTRTSAKVMASSFVGKIVGGSAVGGIVGSAYNTDDSFTDCHVDADITARNTVGGIAGSTSRSLITRCYVEGSIRAIGGEARWYDNGPCAGGIVGDLAPDFSDPSLGEGDNEGAEKAVDPVTFCMVNLSVLEGYTPEMEASFPNQQNTLHRIIGRSNSNFEPEIIGEEFVDDDWVVTYGDPREEEKAINNNYAVADLELGNAEAVADHNTTEGKSVDADELSYEWFKETLGFAYGETAETPWNELSDWDPSLYHEVTSVMTPVELTVLENNLFNIDVMLVSRVPMTEDDFFGGFSFECSNESVVEMTGAMTYSESGIASIEFMALKPGKAIVKMFGSKCEVTVEHDATLGIDDVTGSGSDVKVTVTTGGVSVSNVAEGTVLAVYNLAGVKVYGAVASGADMNIALPAGMYIVKAGDKAVKCAVK